MFQVSAFRRPAMGPVMAGLAAMPLAISSGVAAADQELPASQLPSFVAEHVSRAGFNQPLRKSRVFVSPLGMREEPVNEHPHDARVVITNFKLQHGWLVIPGRKLYARQPDVAIEDHDEDRPVFNEATYEGGLLTTEPCLGITNKKRVKTDFDSVRWECRLDNGLLISREVFDNSLRLVTEVEFASGAFSALTKVRAWEVDPTLLEPPESYTKVSFEYLILGKEQLPIYAPGASGQ